MKKLLLSLGGLLVLGVVFALSFGWYHIRQFESQLVQHDRYESEFWSVVLPEGFIPMFENRELLERFQPKWKEVFELSGPVDEGFYFGNQAQILGFSGGASPLYCARLEKLRSHLEGLGKGYISNTVEIELGTRQWTRWHESARDWHAVNWMTCSEKAYWAVQLGRVKSVPDEETIDKVQSSIGEAKLTESQN
ncbi:MAG: hypothetical protein EA369_00155 [Bradymonadales bacterium]|nr:MAG: hypothetical protein EA369_00155 [Bradymonadales bacterium]